MLDCLECLQGKKHLGEVYGSYQITILFCPCWIMRNRRWIPCLALVAGEQEYLVWSPGGGSSDSLWDYPNASTGQLWKGLCSLWWHFHCSFYSMAFVFHQYRK